MDISLAKLVEAARATGRIRFGDVRRLQRALPTGLKTRAEAEALLSLDHAVDHADEAWAGFLVEAVKEFALSVPEEGEREVARWLRAVLAQSRPKTATAIIREIGEVDPVLVDFAESPRKRTRVYPHPIRVVELGASEETFTVTCCWPAPIYSSSAVFVLSR